MGWLTNPKRRERRDRPFTLTDGMVLKLLEKVSKKVYFEGDEEANKILRLRNISLISTIWIYFKRANEVLNLRLNDVTWDNKNIYYTYRILKKKKRKIKCPSCGLLNGIKSLFCRKCGTNLSGGEVVIIGEDTTVVKPKDLSYIFVPYSMRWFEVAKKYLSPPENAYAYPPFRYRRPFMWFDWSRHITVQMFDKMLQELDPSLTSCHFRYGGSEKYARLGYSSDEQMAIGDWSTPIMPKIYAKRKGLSFEVSKFSLDARLIE